MNTPDEAIILGVLERAPQWLRQDMLAKDAAARTRAEEALAAMIAQALHSEERSAA